MGGGTRSLLPSAQGATVTVDTSRVGECRACNHPLVTHFDTHNVFQGCPNPKPVRAIQLLAMRIRRNAAARADAIQTVRQLPNGRWTVRLGGRMRGHSVVVDSQPLAVQAANDHYNAWAQRILAAARGGSDGHAPK